jgi:chromosome segregation ATPase
VQQTEGANKELQETQTALVSENAGLKSELMAVKTKYDALQVMLQQKTELAASGATSVDELRALVARKDREILQLQKQCADFQEHAKDRDWLAEKSKQVIAKHQDDIKKLIQHHNERKAAWLAKMEEMQQIELASLRKDETIKAMQIVIERAEHQVSEFRGQTEELNEKIGTLEGAQTEAKEMIAYLESQLNLKQRELLDEDALDGDELESPLHRFGTPGKGGELMDYIPQFPTTTSLFELPEFY